MGCDASHIWSSFRNYNSSGRMNGQSMGGLIMFVSLSGRVALNKAFFQLPCQRRHLCSTEVLISWQRDEYDITGGGGFIIFPISILMVAEDDSYNLGSVKSRVIFL